MQVLLRADISSIERAAMGLESKALLVQETKPFVTILVKQVIMVLISYAQITPINAHAEVSKEV